VALHRPASSEKGWRGRDSPSPLASSFIHREDAADLEKRLAVLEPVGEHPPTISPSSSKVSGLIAQGPVSCFAQNRLATELE
jgi:hypothetical protein